MDICIPYRISWLSLVYLVCLFYNMLMFLTLQPTCVFRFEAISSMFRAKCYYKLYQTDRMDRGILITFHSEHSFPWRNATQQMLGADFQPFKLMYKWCVCVCSL